MHVDYFVLENKTLAWKQWKLFSEW